MPTMYGSDRGLSIPSAVKSREDTLPDIPKAKEVVQECGAMDLAEMIFGEDA